MRLFIKIIIVIVLTACTSNKKKNSHASQDSQQLDNTIKAEAIYSDTFSINGISLIQIFDVDRPVTLIKATGDTIIPKADYFFEISFPDINEDGFMDIRAHVFSNTPNQCENYIFNPKNKDFIKIENCYLDIEKVKGARLFFSYNRAGCADNDWESHLIKIEGWKEINVGYIVAKGCGDQNDGVYIYKGNLDSSRLITKMSIDQLKNGFPDKWTFIKHYWTKNYKMFEK